MRRAEKEAGELVRGWYGEVGGGGRERERAPGVGRLVRGWSTVMAILGLFK